MKMLGKSFKKNIYIYIPGTQMTLVLIGKDLVLEGSTTKIEANRFQVYIYIYIYQNGGFFHG